MKKQLSNKPIAREERDISDPNIVHGCISVRWLKARVLAEIDYAYTSSHLSASEGRLNGYMAGLSWVVDYLDLLLEIEREANK